MYGVFEIKAFSNLCPIQKIVFFLDQPLLRLEHDKDNTQKTSKIYVHYRVLFFITAFIWGAFAIFFRRSVQATISRVCPTGNQSAIGGKKKRNIQTLGLIHGDIIRTISHDKICLEFTWFSQNVNI
jgi:hypothetical protein